MLLYVTVDSLSSDTGYGQAVIAVILAIVGVLMYDAFFKDVTGKTYKPKPDQVCVGQALPVDYPYYGGMVEPHACAPQCADNIQRYILYKNGKATQCQLLPGCLDWGEDQGVTCVPEEN